MNTFRRFFGIDESEIKTHCILCPVSNAELFRELGFISRSKGLFFRAITASHATIISVKNNFLIGDCILSLKNSACENVYLFGSCTGAGNIELGSGILVQKSFNLESFSQMLNPEEKAPACYPDEALFRKFKNYLNDESILILNCATVSSLLLEEQYILWLAKNGVSCVDMESSIVFSAAKHIKRKAAAILYVTDIVSKQMPYEKLDKSDAGKIDVSRKKLAKALCDFIKT